MMGSDAVWIEVLDRRGHVVQRTRAAQWPIKLGRGYDCDVLIDDAHVAAHHATLMRDAQTGEIALQSHASMNPAQVATRTLREGEAATLPEGIHETTFGKTRVRIVVGHPPVALAKPLLQQLGNIEKYAGLLFLAALAISAFESWFAMTETVKPSVILTSVMAAGGLLVVWAGGWSFITRLLQGYTAYLSHLGLAAGAALAATILVWVFDVSSFALNWSWLSRWRVLVFGALLVMLLLAHLRVVNGGASTRVTSVVLAGTLGALVVMMVNNYQTHKTVMPASFMAHVLPSSWRVAGETPVEQFYERAKARKAEVDALQKVESDDEGFLE
jgi:hypothetical protein